MNDNKCKICGNEENNKVFIAREMMFGFKDEFTYVECAKCGCLQIQHPPQNISKYYPGNSYYSYQGNLDQAKKGGPFSPIRKKIKHHLQQKLVDHNLGKPTLVGQLLSLIGYKNITSLYWINKDVLNHNSSILDVGCGSGELLLTMHGYGFKNLLGIDPFIKEDLTYKCGVTVQKKFIHEVKDSFDFRVVPKTLCKVQQI